eukprot:2384038-Prymnesium_polylepis.1
MPHTLLHYEYTRGCVCTIHNVDFCCSQACCMTVDDRYLQVGGAAQPGCAEIREAVAELVDRVRHER